MEKRRSDCPLSCGLEIFGDKWTLLIIRDVARFGKKNFREFMQSPEGIATNILSNRLKLLVRHGILTKTTDKDNKLLLNYTLTQKGKDMAPILYAIAEWGQKYVEDSLMVV